jgi:phosphatidate cytidylyltransferase
MNIAGASAASAGFPPARGPELARARAVKPGGAPLSPRTHMQRIASAVVLGLAALAVTWFGGWPFILFWAVAAGAIGWEWVALVGARPRQPVLAIGGAALATTAVLLGVGMISVPVAALVVGAALVLAMDSSRHRGWTAFGVFYAAAALLPVVLLREGTNGLVAVLWLFAVVWATDVAAFYFGRAFDGPLLWPAVSPKKTWSGAIGGALAAVVAGAAMIWAAGIVLRPPHALIAFIVSVAAQAGDLFESAMKRKFGVKDASHFIPGHGGVMDRLDGFVAGATVALAIGIARAGANAAVGLVTW